MTKNSGRPILWLILVLTLLHGSLYAFSLPPWGLLDEQQHFHYIQHLAQESALPIVGHTYLSPEIMESMFETGHWETFHWPTPSSNDPREMGLQAHSYEGYQPPLFYLLLVPAYAILPGGVLLKLYLLRLLAVCLSLFTIVIIYNTAADLFPRHTWLPAGVALLLAVLPERVASVSRVNNDVLLEVLGAAFVWIWTRTMLRGISGSRARLLGLALGLGILTKSSMGVLVILLPLLFWLQRHTSNVWKNVLWTVGTTGAVLTPWVARNLAVYGDLTGFSSFRVLNDTFRVVVVPVVTWHSASSAAVDLFRHFWFIWWKGATTATHPVLEVALVVLGVVSAIALLGLVRRFSHAQKNEGKREEERILVAYALVVGAYAAAVTFSYFRGQIPVIQGRFFLPVMVPAILLLGRGLQLWGYGKHLIVATFALLVGLSALSLFGNLLPYYYYWSAFAGEGSMLSPSSLSTHEAWAMFTQRMLSDKPTVIEMFLGGTMALYPVILVLTGIRFWKVGEGDLHCQSVKDGARERIGEFS